MKRFDLRHLKDDFYERMVELVERDITVDEVAIFLFEIGDFTAIQKSADVIKESGHDLINSLKFNEVDWTIVVKKVNASMQKERQDKIRLVKEETDKLAADAAEEEAK